MEENATQVDVVTDTTRRRFAAAPFHIDAEVFRIFRMIVARFTEVRNGRRSRSYPHRAGETCQQFADG